MSGTHRANNSDHPAVSSDIGIDSIPDAVLVADPGTRRIVRANRAAGELFDCELSKLVGCKQTELHPTGEEAEYIEAFQRGLEGERVNRLRNGDPLLIETFNGRTKPVEINVQKVNTSEGGALLGVFREVSDQLERERDLETKTSRLNTLLDALPVPVAVVDTDGTVTRWNTAAEATYGYTAGAVVGEQYPLFIEDEEFVQLFEQILDGGMLDGYETTHRASDGSRIPVELYVRPIYENEEMTGMIGSAIDISDRKQRKKQLNVLHRVLRHNLRNELNVITAWSQQLDPVDAEQQQAAEKIKSASDRLVELSEDAKRIRTSLTNTDRQGDSVPFQQVGAELTQHVTDEESVSLRHSEHSETGSVSIRGVRAVSELLDEISDSLGEKEAKVTLETHESYLRVDVTTPPPALPTGMQSFINRGEETALEHGSDLAVARVTLVIDIIGGEISFTGNDDGATKTLRIELPRTDD